VPELPETETIARDLDREVAGRSIVAVAVRRPDVLRGITGPTLKKRLAGGQIARVWRRAKSVVLDLAGADRIVVTPRFTGALLIDAGALADREREYSTLDLALDDGRTLLYRDIRRLGTVALMSPSQFEAYSARIGVEPLDPSFSTDQLSALVRDSRQAIKKVLMDQRYLAGIGNIYANEILWRAEIDPSRAARSLDDDEIHRVYAATREILPQAIAARGTSFRDYRDASGSRGTFAEQLDAYGRGGEACRRCHRRLVETHAIDGRSTVFCFHCQH
jgi:formamidopyrimidine-DNA glycosylase